jgi:hypothetical protein
MPQTPFYPRIGTVAVLATLNAIALIVLLGLSGAISGKSLLVITHAHSAPMGWFGIGVLFSGATIFLYYFARYYYGKESRSNLVISVVPVASIMSLLMFILAIWEWIRLM